MVLSFSRDLQWSCHIPVTLLTNTHDAKYNSDVEVAVCCHSISR